MWKQDNSHHTPDIFIYPYSQPQIKCTNYIKICINISRIYHKFLNNMFHICEEVFSVHFALLPGVHDYFKKNPRLEFFKKIGLIFVKQKNTATNPRWGFPLLGGWWSMLTMPTTRNKSPQTWTHAFSMGCESPRTHHTRHWLEQCVTQRKRHSKIRVGSMCLSLMPKGVSPNSPGRVMDCIYSSWAAEESSVGLASCPWLTCLSSTRSS